LREHPADTAQRVFLFELLCFAGEYTRAEKQLSVLAGKNVEAETGAIVYYAALHAEKTRHEIFEKQTFPGAPDDLPTRHAERESFHRTERCGS
jgi:type VI secretion system protein ImpE